MTAAVLVSSAQEPRRATLAAAIGVLVGLVWLAAFALATTAGWTQLRSCRRPTPPRNRWMAAAGWALAAAFLLTITIVITGATV